MTDGIVLPHHRRNSEHTSQSYIQPLDYGYAVLLWVYLQVGCFHV